MNLLNPTSVVEAGEFMAPHLGTDWEQNRCKVVEGINAYREHLYNKYHRRRLFDAVFHCFVPQRFPLDCTARGRCCNFYWGATLPPDVMGVVKAWNSSVPLRVRSRWREAFTGMIQCNSEMSLTLMPQNFPTERALTSGSPLRFYTEHSADSGKVVFMEALTAGGVKRLRFDLQADSWMESKETVYDILSVTLPSGRKGSLILANADGYELSVYAPWEKVPAYQRVKFLQPCPNNIFIQGTRRYVDVWFDPDIVEVGSKNIMKFYAVYVRHSTGRDQRDRDTAANALAQANEDLDGLIARAVAGAIQDGPKPGPRRSKILPGYARSHTQ